MSGLATVLVIGNRKGFGKERFEPHNILVTFMGMSMLWVGWYGFNAGTLRSDFFRFYDFSAFIQVMNQFTESLLH